MTPLNLEYLGADYWALAERDDPDERDAAQVSRLCRILEAHAPGRRVVDVGCGLGRHAIALAKAGFVVTALDASASTIQEARRRGAAAGAEVRWEVVDPLAESPWPLETMDAAICMRWFGWGKEAGQRRLLWQIRCHLVVGGLLVVQHATPFRLAGSVLTTVADGRPDLMDLTYDPATGRVSVSVPVSAPSNPDRTWPQDIHLYTPAELASLVRDAGYAVERVDLDRTPWQTRPSGSGTVQVHARTLATPPASLAVASWGTPPGVQLDLRYAPDEAELLDPPPSVIWQKVIHSVARYGADLVASYPVDDPYGGERGAGVVTAHFGCPVAAHQLTFAAGVTSLLHCLCGLADGGPVAAPELVHPDLEAWAAVRSIEVRPIAGPATCGRLLAAIDAIRPALLHLDRPAFTGQLLPLAELEMVVREASAAGAVVVIDESGAPYLGPASSAVRLVGQVHNLVVLRGFTKAYSWGGLRVGFAVASDAIAARVRRLVPPLQVGELAFQAALRLLADGDVFGRLRGRIHAVKPYVTELLKEAGLQVLESHPDVPRVAVVDVGGTASAHLQRCGIRGLHPAPVPGAPRSDIELLQITIPLSADRVALFRDLLTGALEEERWPVVSSVLGQQEPEP
jgi:histidinol-phosphate/aromatic aminotransferase/cobyric acid decarboxylase-like protein/SAM-dependent methyltransferase